MRVKKGIGDKFFDSPKHSFVMGTMNDLELRTGFGIGFSYYEDGELTFGFILGNRYFYLDVMWGKAEELSYHEEEEQAERELEEWLAELAEQEGNEGAEWAKVREVMTKHT